jgi:para-nitrobenzyl esterase
MTTFGRTLAVLLLAGASAGAAAAQSASATTQAGELRGYQHARTGVLAFKGVHYGASTAGEARFTPPRPVAPWVGTREAREFGPVCHQLGTPGLQALVDDGPDTRELPQSEDCLLLNVWTPALSGARPVMVWLHGRGFAQGAGSEPLYDGAALARRGDVVVITVNHRLNVFGYLELGAIDEAFSGSGMVGLLDVQLALEWVRDNAAAFGGDPANVTLFGESGGGAKVSTLLAMPSARGLFHRGIIQSGPALRGVTADAAAEMARRVMADAGVTQISELQALPADRLLQAMAGGVDSPALGGAALRFAPVVDGRFLPAHPYEPVAARPAAGVPIMIGTTRDEALLFLLGDPHRGTLTEAQLSERVTPLLGAHAERVVEAYRRSRPQASPWDIFVAISSERFRLGSILLAERHGATGAPVYMYSFDFEVNPMVKAAHGMEIAFAFSNASARPGSREETRAVETAVSEAWIAFARSGDPSHGAIPRWPTYDPERRATMVFDVESQVVDDLRREERLAWDGVALSR